MKPCICCGTEKPLSDYYTHPMMADGHLNKCKTCCRQYAKKRHREKSQDPDWVEHERARGRKKYHDLGYRGKYHPRPEQKRAYARSQHLPCPEGCEKHHWSYRKGDEADVIVLARSTHALLHAKLVYDSTHMVYRTRGGALLDTREKHESFIVQQFGPGALGSGSAAPVGTGAPFRVTSYPQNPTIP